MSKTILPIYGSIGIQSYGLFVAIGVILSTWLFLKNPKAKKIISPDQFKNTLLLAIVGGIVGGRALYIIEDPTSVTNVLEAIQIWEGGLSSLGSIITILIVLPLYLAYIRVPIVQFFDLLGIYAPLTYAIARIGCFFAGCCYGTESNVPWAIMYKKTDSVAPLCKTLHPAQLYSSAASFLVFLLMFFILSQKLKKPGQLITSYLFLASMERFLIDFVRGDKTYFTTSGILSQLSTSQSISLLTGITSLLILFFITAQKNKKNEYI